MQTEGDFAFEGMGGHLDTVLSFDLWWLFYTCRSSLDGSAIG